MPRFKERGHWFLSIRKNDIEFMAFFILWKKLVCTVMIFQNLEALSMMLWHDFAWAFTYMAAPSSTTCQKCTSRPESIWAQVILKISSTVSLRISCLSSQCGSEFSLEHSDLKCFLNSIEMMVKKFKGEYIHKSRHREGKSLEERISWSTSEIWTSVWHLINQLTEQI